MLDIDTILLAMLILGIPLLIIIYVFGVWVGKSLRSTK